MNCVNSLSPPDDTFSEPTGLSYQDGTKEPRSYYHGMSVNTLNSPSSIYLNHSDTDQNNTHIINPLNKFGVAALTQTAPYDFNNLNLPVKQESTLDEYALYKPDTEYSDDPLLSISSDQLFNPSRFSGNKLDISEPTPTNLLNPEYHLIHLSAELTNPQDSRPVAGINRLNQEQTASDNPANSAEIVDDKSLQVEQKKAHQRRLQREFKRERRKDPVYSAREKERRKNPAYLARERERKRNRRKDPILGEHMRKLQREYKMKRRKDPILGEFIREYHRKYQRRRCQDDPVFAEGERVYKRTYFRMKKEFSKKEASELASVARQQYLQSMHSPEDSADVSQTSHPAETTLDSNKNS